MWKVVYFLPFFFLSACGSNASVKLSNGLGSADDSAHPPQSQICSKLNFSNVTWPTNVQPPDREAFMLALNISGSFEGHQQWSNIATSFDGQGLSMGLLNQNLGQGTLQPLLIQMREQNPSTLKAIFSSAHLSSLLQMLASWEAAAGIQTAAETSLSPLDKGIEINPLVTTQNSASVAWAKNNLYSSGSFRTDWWTELTNLGESDGYVSLQINSATKLHTKAKKYLNIINVHELRTYLFAFDIVEQNGGFYQVDIDDYRTYLANNSHSTGTQNLLEILQLRLREVSSKFTSDVQERKLAIINGSGSVHQSNRHLEKEYCYLGSTTF